MAKRMASAGSPPGSSNAGIGKVFRLSPVAKKTKELSKHGITKIHSACEAAPSNYMPDPTLMLIVDEIVEKRMPLVRKEMEKEVENRMGMLMASKAWRFNLESYKLVTIRRLFQEWSMCKKGKAARDSAIKALAAVYGKEGIPTPCDFVAESKTLLGQLRKAQADGDSRAVEGCKERLDMIKRVAQENFLDNASFSGQGFVDVLNSYSEANDAVHKGFTEQELIELLDEARELSTEEAVPWLRAFASDLLAIKRGS